MFKGESTLVDVETQNEFFKKRQERIKNNFNIHIQFNLLYYTKQYKNALHCDLADTHTLDTKQYKNALHCDLAKTHTLEPWGFEPFLYQGNDQYDRFDSL